MEEPDGGEQGVLRDLDDLVHDFAHQGHRFRNRDADGDPVGGGPGRGFRRRRIPGLERPPHRRGAGGHHADEAGLRERPADPAPHPADERAVPHRNEQDFEGGGAGEFQGDRPGPLGDLRLPAVLDEGGVPGRGEGPGFLLRGVEIVPPQIDLGAEGAHRPDLRLVRGDRGEDGQRDPRSPRRPGEALAEVPRGAGDPGTAAALRLRAAPGGEPAGAPRLETADGVHALHLDGEARSGLPAERLRDELRRVAEFGRDRGPGGFDPFRRNPFAHRREW